MSGALESALSTEARLRLFAQVCQAIQHAHQKGIIHRDLKPSNILVTVNDGTPVPKVIDFGIAKAIGHRLTDKTLFTQFHSLIGTPAYISPEQAEMSSVDIDTRSDIYSLGVLLYELLTGKTPFDGEELLRSGLDAMRTTIREKQPVRPSTRLAEQLPGSDGRRCSSSPSATRSRKSEIPSDLDWIVMKCLEKDRARRYATANGIAADIQRHLEKEPVMARPPSGIYRLQRLAQRNRAALIAMVTVFAAMFVAVLALATSNSQIRQERSQKDKALRERGAALEAARASERLAREQLFVSLQNQAHARRNSRQIGQRLESLAALAEAARIRLSPELRDNAIAAMALPDVEFGPVWSAWTADTKGFAYDSLHQRYGLLEHDGTISIRTIPDGRELQRLQFSAGVRVVRALTFSPDGRFIACLGLGGDLHVWDWERRQSVLKNTPVNGLALAFSADSRRVAVGHDTSITCFDLKTGEESRRWQAEAHAWSLSFHPDGHTLAVGYSDSSVVSIYSADDGENSVDLPLGDSSSTTVAWHPEGNILAAGGSDPRIQIWDVKERRKLAVLEGHFEHVSSLEFHHGGELLFSTSWDGTVRLWQPSPGRLLMRLPVGGWFGSSRESGRWTGVVSPSNLHAQLWAIVPSQEYHTFLNSFKERDSALREGEISPDGTLLALGATDGVRLWNVARGREVASLRRGDTTSVLFWDEGRELLTCGAPDGLWRWRITATTEPAGGLLVVPSHQIRLPFAPARMAKSRDERTLAVAAEDGQCVLLDLANETVRGPEMPHLYGGFIALSSDSKQVASSGWHSDRVKVWDGTSFELLKELAPGVITLVFFTPDNRELIVARDREFTFHDVISFAVSRRIPRDMGLHAGHVAFTTDGKLMAMEISPGVIHLKETASARTVAKLEDPSGNRSTWMSFTPDGTQLVVVARYDGSIHRWDLRAIRARLKTMNLDWDWPEFSAFAPATHRLLAPETEGPARRNQQLAVQRNDDSGDRQ